MAEHVYEEQITIDAPAAAVWALLVDVERWPRWTASVRAVSLLGPAPLQVGSKVRVRQPRMPAMTWTVDQLDPGSSFSWTVRSLGVHGVADHRVDAAPHGCRVTLEIKQTGRLAGLARLAFGRLTRRYMLMEAESLKHVTETVRT